MDCSPLGSSVHGIFQARILEWVQISPPRDLPDPGIEPTSLMSPALQEGSFPLALPGNPAERSLDPSGQAEGAGLLSSISSLISSV